MPIYVYGCKNCNEEFEMFRRMDDEKKVFCPKCKSDFVEKLVAGGSNFHLKGDWSW